MSRDVDEGVNIEGAIIEKVTEEGKSAHDHSSQKSITTQKDRQFLRQMVPRDVEEGAIVEGVITEEEVKTSTQNDQQPLRQMKPQDAGEGAIVEKSTVEGESSSKKLKRAKMRHSREAISNTKLPRKVWVQLRKMLKSKRVYGLPGTNGSFYSNFVAYSHQNHILLAMWYAHPQHTFSRKDRNVYFLNSILWLFFVTALFSLSIGNSSLSSLLSATFGLVYDAILLRLLNCKLCYKSAVWEERSSRVGHFVVSVLSLGNILWLIFGIVFAVKIGGSFVQDWLLAQAISWAMNLGKTSLWVAFRFRKHKREFEASVARLHILPDTLPMPESPAETKIDASFCHSSKAVGSKIKSISDVASFVRFNMKSNDICEGANTKLLTDGEDGKLNNPAATSSANCVIAVVKIAKNTTATQADWEAWFPKTQPPLLGPYFCFCDPGHPLIKHLKPVGGKEGKREVKQGDIL
eukprot:jgi/Bigna1/83198/fgenesh1_pg.103_\